MAGRVELHTADDRAWLLGEDRRRVLTELASREQTTAKVVEDAAKELGINRSYCYRLLRRFRAEPATTALIPRARGRSRGARQFSPDVESLVAAAIDEFYLRRTCPSVADLLREIERRCSARTLKPPSYKAVTERLHVLDQREVLRRRKGASYARRKLGRIVGRLTEDQPLGLVQIDHTLADVIVVSTEERHPLTRPWLTLAIDIATRMVTGFYLSLEPPSALSVALALSSSVLPKEEYLEDRGVDLPWPVSGLPTRLHLDNAKVLSALAPMTDLVAAERLT